MDGVGLGAGRQRLGRRAAARGRRRVHAPGPPAPAATARRRPRRARALAHGRRGAVAGRPRRRPSPRASRTRPRRASVATLLQRGLHAPETSSLGRWFDAAAGLLGVTRRMAFEGQAAMLLEGLAEAHGPVDAEPGLVTVGADNELDLGALALRLADERDAGRGAALFHATLVAALADWVARAARRAADSPPSPAAAAAFSMPCWPAGCGANSPRAGSTMLEAQAVPPNDGGLVARPGLGGAAGPRHFLKEIPDVPRPPRPRRRTDRRRQRRRRTRRRAQAGLAGAGGGHRGRRLRHRARRLCADAARSRQKPSRR